MDYENLCLNSKDPFPEIENAVRDNKTVGILKDLISDRGGELFATLMYSFQQFVCKEKAQQISKIIEEISIVEMKHMELLSNAMIQFGGVPVFTNERGEYFNANYVNYTTNLYEILTTDIKAEKGAVEAYTQAANMVTNESLKNLLLRIRADEECHLSVFEKLLREVEFFTKYN